MRINGQKVNASCDLKFGSILAGLSKGSAVGIAMAGIFGLLLFVIYIYARYFQKKEEEKTKLPQTSMAFSTQDGNGIFLHIHILSSY
jgi:hypothetical protein